MSNLNSQQFEQEGLFPEDHPAMRRRGLAEMRPEQFQEHPDAWYHGTYKDSMPERIDARISAGIHFGTKKAAEDRINHMGPKETNPSEPGDIHVRHLRPEVAVQTNPSEPRLTSINTSGPYMAGSKKYPKEDRGDDWSRPGGGDRHFGEFYHNVSEDPGSVSIRVPNSGYITSHRQAISEAIRSGAPVHPLNKGLLQDFGGKGIDEPIKYMANDNRKGWQAKDPMADEAVSMDAVLGDEPHESLLPYKVRANPRRRTLNPPLPMRTEGPYSPGEQRQRRPAITFTATEAEAREMTGEDRADEIMNAPRTSGKEYITAAAGRRPLTPLKRAQQVRERSEWTKNYRIV